MHHAENLDHIDRGATETRERVQQLAKKNTRLCLVRDVNDDQSLVELEANDVHVRPDSGPRGPWINSYTDDMFFGIIFYPRMGKVNTDSYS